MLAASRKEIIDIRRHKMGMVFQNFALFPHRTVIDNITLAPRLVRHMSKEDAEAAAMALLERVKIPEQAFKYVGTVEQAETQAKKLESAT